MPRKAPQVEQLPLPPELLPRPKKAKGEATEGKPDDLVRIECLTVGSPFLSRPWPRRVASARLEGYRHCPGPHRIVPLDSKPPGVV